MQHQTLTGLTLSTIQADRIHSSLIRATFREEQIRIAAVTLRGMRRVLENNQTQIRQRSINRTLTSVGWGVIAAATVGYLYAIHANGSSPWFTMLVGISAGACLVGLLVYWAYGHSRPPGFHEGIREAVRSSGKEISVSALDNPRARQAKAIFRDEGALIMGLDDSSVTAFRPPV